MKLAFLLGLFVSACLLVSCDDPITQSIKESMVTERVKADLAEMPRTAEFDVAKVLVFASIENGKPFKPGCYVAQGIAVVGSSVSTRDVIDRYVELVQAKGWVLRQDQYKDDKVLERGENEWVNITKTYPGRDVVQWADYAQFQANYASVIFANVTYYIC